MHRVPALATVLALVLVIGAVPPASGASVGHGATGVDRVPAQDEAPPDPAEDTLGWEAGYWANESVTVNTTDGINETERRAIVARGMARVEAIRGLEFLETVPVEIETRESFRAERANRSTDPELAVFDNAKFEALLLVGEDEDSIAVQNENTGSAVLGFYSTEREAIVLISEDPENLQLEELTLAHELVHALQDQHFNLSRYDARTRDGVNAENGLIEGDAKYVELAYRGRCDDGGAWNGSCVRPSVSFDDGGGQLANIGTYLVKFQPYSDGPRFISNLLARGGWEAVNAAYDRPPNSSEQIIHPEKYLEDEPTDVALEDLNDSTWRRVRPPARPDYATVGEASLTAMLVYPLYDSGGRTQIIPPSAWLNRTADGELSSFDPLVYENRYTTGWDGDRLHVYRNDSNETAYVWRLVWDTPADAREFVNGYLQALRYWGAERVAGGTWVIDEGRFADAFHVNVVGDSVTIVNAPRVADLSTVRSDVEATPSPTPGWARTVDVITITVRTPTVAGAETPDDPTPSSDSPTTATPGQPGFGLLIATLALLLVAVLARRRAE